jgi:hypothetical protein
MNSEYPREPWINHGLDVGADGVGEPGAGELDRVVDGPGLELVAADGETLGELAVADGVAEVDGEGERDAVAGAGRP